MYMSSRWIFYPDFSLNIKWMHFHAFIKSLHTAVYVRIIVYSIIYLNVPYCLSCFLIFYSCFLIFAIINNSQEISLFIKGRFQNWHLFKGILLDVLIGKLQKKKKVSCAQINMRKAGLEEKKRSFFSAGIFRAFAHEELWICNRGICFPDLLDHKNLSFQEFVSMTDTFQ